MNSTQTYGSSLYGYGLTNVGLAIRTRIVARYIRGNRILDVGCADGSMLKKLVFQSVHTTIVGLDRITSFPQIKGVSFLTAAAETLPFPDASFDTVICSATRKHLRNPLVVFGEICRVLCKGGRLIVLDPNPLIVRLGMKIRKFDPRWIRHNSWAGEVCREMKQCGLRVISSANGIYVMCVGEKPGVAANMVENLRG